MQSADASDSDECTSSVSNRSSDDSFIEADDNRDEDINAAGKPSVSSIWCTYVIYSELVDAASFKFLLHKDKEMLFSILPL